MTLASTTYASEPGGRINFRIEAVGLGEAMDALAEQAGVQLLYPYERSEATGLNPVVGQYTLREALAEMFRDTEFSAGLTEDGIVTISFIENQNDREDQVQSGKIKKGLLASVSAFLLGVGGNGAAIAQNKADGVSSSEFDTIIVTAQKREQNINEVPISIVALSGDELSARQIDNFETLGLAVPGLSVQDDGAFNRRIFLRGVGNTSGSSPTVGLYLDEVSLTGGVNNSQIDVRPYDVQRVEVLRGPQGTLFGDGSVGGTIRFVSNSPELDEVSGSATASGSFTEDGAPSQKAIGVLNIPLVEDVFGLRIVGAFEHSGGWIDQPSAGQTDINDQSVGHVRVKALWRPIDDLDITAMAVVHRNDAGAPNFNEDDGGDFTQAFGLTTTPSTKDDYELYNVTLNYDLGAVEIFSTTSYVDNDKNTEQLGGAITFLPPPLPKFETFFADREISTEIFTQEVRISSDDAGPVNWLLGGFYRDSEGEQNIPELFFGLPGPLPPAGVSSLTLETSEAWAVFGDVSIDITERLQVGGGLRYFEDERTQIDGVAMTTRTASFDSLNPRAFIKYNIAGDVNAYASVAKGFRSGGFSFAAGFDPYEPESVWTYEAGLKGSIADGVISGDIAVFFSDYSDYQISSIAPPPSPPLNVISNAGDAEIIGVDWNLRLKATDSLTLEVSGNVVDAEFVSVETAGVASHIAGDRLDFVPKYQYSVSGIYDFWVGERPAFLRLDYSEQGRSEIRNRTIGDFYFSQSDVINMFNASLGVSISDTVSVSLFGENLADDRGFIDPLSIDLLAARPRPRTVGAQVSVDF